MLLPKHVAYVVAACVLLVGTSVARAQSLGRISFPTSGAAAAQPAFIRGVLYLHSFEYESAAEAFREAQRLDRTFAMAYWGEALTYTHQIWNEQNVDAARKALNALAATPDARRAAARTPKEQAYLMAVDALYGAGSKAARDTAYADAMSQMYAQYPEDDEVAILYATALFGLSQGVRDVPLYMRAGAIAQEVFEHNPWHPGAAHMIIHAFDDPTHAPLGLRAARAYSKIAPSAGHAQHMTTHIFLALGLWDDVVSQNIAAAGADTAKWLPGHYTSWLVYAYLQQGRYRDARALLNALAEHATLRARNAMQSHTAMSDDRRGVVANLRARYVLETQQWDSPEARALDADLGKAGEDDYEYATFAAGYAAAQRGERTKAQAYLQRLSTRNGRASQTVKPGAPGITVVPVILELELRAALLANAGQSNAAIALLERAVRLEDAMPPEFGPPAVVLPTHELLGGMLMTAKRWAPAAEQFALALQLQPGRAMALLGSARAEAARGRESIANRAFRTLATNWSRADSTIGSLAEVRRSAAARP